MTYRGDEEIAARQKAIEDEVSNGTRPAESLWLFPRARAEAAIVEYREDPSNEIQPW